MYKYLTWSEGKYYEGHNLVSRSGCVNIINSLRRTQCEVYATIQDYDSDGNCIGCPLYFDIDSSSLYDAWENARALYDSIIEEFDAVPFVWFSGGKGFHILSPLYVKHPRCHEIVQLIQQDLFKHIDCDPKVYRTRSMFRVENTWNIKGGKYKIPCDNWNQLSLQDIYKQAGTQTHGSWRSQWIKRELNIADYIDRLPTFKQSDVTGSLDFDDMMPCLRNLWLADTPPEGERHSLAYIFIRHCFRAGLSMEETASLFHGHKFWSQVRENDYMKIIRSVYTRGIAALGCANNKLLQDNCVIACKYNSEFDLRNYIRR